MTSAECPNGHPVEPGDSFCSVCGEAVRSPEPGQAQTASSDEEMPWYKSWRGMVGIGVVAFGLLSGMLWAFEDVLSPGGEEFIRNQAFLEAVRKERGPVPSDLELANLRRVTCDGLDEGDDWIDFLEIQVGIEWGLYEGVTGDRRLMELAVEHYCPEHLSVLTP